MKTPDEIKKALKYHKDLGPCFDCPYDCFDSYCSVGLAADALAYIEQLESRVKTDRVCLPRIGLKTAQRPSPASPEQWRSNGGGDIREDA